MSGTQHTITGVTGSGNSLIDGLLRGLAWADGTLYYSFPASDSEYTYSNVPDDFLMVSELQQTAAQFILDADVGDVASAGFSVEGFTNLLFEMTTDVDAHLRFAGTDDSSVNTAYAYYPSTNNSGGDIWFGTNYDYTGPLAGNYAWLTLIHEVGHALGLKHGHSNFPTLPFEYDSMEYSVMTYRSFVGGPLTGYTNEQFGYAQTYMMADIAALQYMYGANFTINSEDTVYSWTPNSGDTLVNDEVAIDAGGNRIFATIWDGDGIDTYDLNAYNTDMIVDLTPGGHSYFDAAQIAYLGYGNYARGNIFNALQYQDDVRSLIENAIAGSGDDMVIGNAAGNVLTGNGGDDHLIGNDNLDYAVFSGAMSEYTITYNGDGTFTVAHNANGADGIDTLESIEIARFSDGDETLISILTEMNDTQNGTSGSDRYNGLAGDDIIAGLAGDDLIYGDAGNDTLSGDDGNDFLFGGSGDDILNGGAGNDIIQGGVGADTIDGGADVDTLDYTASLAGINVNLDTQFLTGGDAEGDTVAGIEIILATQFADTLIGDANDNIFEGGAGNDTLIGGAGADTLNGGAGDDIASYAGSGLAVDVNLGSGAASGGVADGDTLAGIENLIGSDYNDRLFGDNGDNVITGGAGNDVLAGANGDDLFYGDSGDDTIYTGGGLDTAYGGDGVDRLIGGADANSLYGDAGNDFLYGKGGNDLLEGGAGNDFIAGDDGNDTLNGGAGNDRLSGGNGDDTINGGDGDDQIYGGNGDDQIYGGDGNDTMISSAGDDTILSGNGDDLVYAGDGVNYVDGGGDNDVLIGGIGVDTFTGGTGNDRIYAQSGNDVLYGKDGNDGLYGGDGNDELFGGAGADVLASGQDDDYLEGGDGADLFYAGSGDDQSYGGVGNDTIFAGAGDDLLDGGDGDDRLYAEQGSNILDGGAGSDHYFGSASGADTFIFTAGAEVTVERVSFFETSDTVQLNGFGFASAASAANAFSQSGNNVLFVDSGMTITFYNAVLADVLAAVSVNGNAGEGETGKILVSEVLDTDVDMSIDKVIVCDDDAGSYTLDQDLIAEFLVQNHEEIAPFTYMDNGVLAISGDGQSFDTLIDADFA